MVVVRVQQAVQQPVGHDVHAVQRAWRRLVADLTGVRPVVSRGGTALCSPAGPQCRAEDTRVRTSGGTGTARQGSVRAEPVVGARRSAYAQIENPVDQVPLRGLGGRWISRRRPGARWSSRRTPGARWSSRRTPGARWSSRRTPGARWSSRRTPGARWSSRRRPGGRSGYSAGGGDAGRRGGRLIRPSVAGGEQDNQHRSGNSAGQRPDSTAARSCVHQGPQYFMTVLRLVGNRSFAVPGDTSTRYQVGFGAA